MVATLPVVYDFVIYRRTTFRCHLRWLPAPDSPQDFTGWTGVMRIGPRRQPALMEVALTLDSEGQITATLDAEATAELPIGALLYDMDLTDPDVFTTRLMRGQISVVSDVESPEEAP